MKNIISHTVIVIGSELLLFPFVLYWFVHGNNQERYQWVISGPTPFSNFGSGPYTLWLGIGFWLLGAVLITIGLLGRKFINGKTKS